MLLILSIPICAFIGALLASSKGRKVDGLILGALLGPIGWIIILFLSESAEEQGCAYALWTLARAAFAAAIVTALGVAWYRWDQERTRGERERSWQAEQARIAAQVAQKTEAKAARLVTPTPSPRRTPTPREIAEQIAERYGKPH